jgi:PRA1 family protein 1
VPPWGRPPGARLSRGQRAWAAQQQSWSEYDDRFEELETDDDGFNGVGLNRSKGSRYSGIDPRRYDYEEDYSPSDDESYDVSTGLVRRSQGQLMLRHKEDALVERALERIRRARALGKTNVKLSRAEIDALERLERSHDSPPTPPIPMPAPKQAVKGKKAPQPKQKAIEAKKPMKSSKSAGNSPKPKPKESRSRGQSVASNRSKGSAKDEVPYPVSPDDYYGPPAWYGRPGGPNSLQQEARAGSSRTRQRESMPPYPYYAHAYNSHPDVRYGPRPGSNSSWASRPDPSDPDWEPRARSTSSLVSYPVDQLPQQAIAGTGRAPRFDPSDPRFASPPTRRVVSGPPGPSRGRTDELFLPDDQPDALQYLTESTNNDESRSTSDSDDSGQGVQVDVEERQGGAYAIQTRAAAQKRAANGKGAARKRR